MSSIERNQRLRRPCGKKFAVADRSKHLLRSETMNWDTVKGDWKSFKGKVKEQWGKLTDDELDRIEGRRDQLAGAIQKRYGVAKDEVERQMKEFEKSCDSCATSTAHRVS
jgi:uncharacterized protein YjbJ (UPF0337 family)